MKSVLIKLSGELFKKSDASTSEHACMNITFVQDIVSQIRRLTETHHVSIVIGGGNFFRGSKEGRSLGLKQTTADAVGMLATVMNGIILQDFMLNAGIKCLLLGATPFPGLIMPIAQTCIEKAKTENTVLIFTGGTGNPYFSTDTAAVLRALQVEASEVWKATTVDYIYDDDPSYNANAQAIKKITYHDVLMRKLKIMDLTAITLAQEHNITIRVFSIYSPHALEQVAQNDNFGSSVSA